MTVPAFEEYVPAIDCTCAGCAAQRRTAASALPMRYGGHPAAHGARRALVLATAAGVVLSTGVAEAASATSTTGTTGATDDRAAEAAGAVRTDQGGDSPQGGPGPLRGGGASGPPSSTTTTPKLRKSSRADIINRAKKWVSADVPYSMVKYWSDGYRQDCSGFVSMAWNLPGNEWTGSLAAFGKRIAREELQPGDILLFHNPADPSKGSHVTIFGGWTDYTHTHYTAYEQTKPHTRKKTTPMAYWTNSGSYVAYRYKALSGGNGGSASSVKGFPGAGQFGPGASNKYVTQLGRMLTDRGGKRFYKVGPGPGWGDADRRATQAFQKAQGWKGKEADGLPGPATWRLLANGTGRDIPGTGSGSGGGGGTGAGHGESNPGSKFPGRGYFRPGQSNSHVGRLGKQLVKKGFGKYYTSGPGPRWTEADRRNVEAFQRAQGWRGGAADGYPGPETWRRLFG
ncbi:peptidoglycan-binding protein [Streptomyces sp. NBC_01591]|uniref:peptidoglycan-binding protein n=1 Tax=Streptomyces sp. NBC_01591 TaxID=2975888 RepID=UPI002DDA622E|nr:peptidoglycan-binding protein [Streptomyces sp. NBC_01591]WSD68628.1 peptidoglycan-binding protein [Streptomyces sp. NBC_01591]